MDWIQEHPLETLLVVLLIVRTLAAVVRKTVHPAEGSRLDGILDVAEGLAAHVQTILSGLGKIKGRPKLMAPVAPPPKGQS